MLHAPNRYYSDNKDRFLITVYYHMSTAYFACVYYFVSPDDDCAASSFFTGQLVKRIR